MGELALVRNDTTPYELAHPIVLLFTPELISFAAQPTKGEFANPVLRL